MLRLEKIEKIWTKLFKFRFLFYISNRMKDKLWQDKMNRPISPHFQNRRLDTHEAAVQGMEVRGLANINICFYSGYR